MILVAQEDPFLKATSSSDDHFFEFPGWSLTRPAPVTISLIPNFCNILCKVHTKNTEPPPHPDGTGFSNNFFLATRIPVEK